MADGPLSRRDFVKAAVITASAAALGVGALSSVLPALSGGPQAAPSPIARRVGATLVPITVHDLDGPPVALVVAEWQFLPAIVLKVRTETLRRSSELRGYNAGQFAVQHPTEAETAIVAYEGKCTHLGCTVGFNTTLGESKDIPDYAGDGLEGRILCPCHFAQFDVFDLAKNVPGTPGPRPLPALVIRLGAERDGSRTIEGLRKIPQPTYRAADEQGDGAEFRLAS